MALTLRLGKPGRSAQFALPPAGAPDPIAPPAPHFVKACPGLDAVWIGKLIHVPAQLRRWNRALRAALATILVGCNSPTAASTMSVAIDGDRQIWPITLI